MNPIFKNLIILLILVGYQTNLYSNTLDSLLEKTSSSSNLNNTELTTLYFQIGVEYHKNDSFKNGIKYFELSLKHTLPKADPDAYFHTLQNLGNAHKRLSDDNKALEYFYKIIESEEPKASFSAIANANTQIGTIYNSFGDYEKAYQFQLEALNAHELAKDTSGIGRDYYAIGSILFYQDRFQQSLEYYQKAHSFFIKINHDRLIYSSLAAMGSCYFRLDEIEKSLDYGNQALIIAKELNYKTGIAYSLGNLGSSTMALGKMKEAKKMLEASLQLKIEMKDDWAIIGSHLRLAEIYTICKMPIKSFPHLEKALTLSNKIDSKTRLMETYNYYEKAYKELGDFDQAYNYLKKHSVLKDSILNEKTVEQMGKAKKRMELEKKENEIKLLKSKNHVLVQNKHIQKLKSLLILGFAILLLLSCWFASSKLKLVRNTNQLLAKKNAKIENQNQKLQQTKGLLIQANGKLKENNLEIKTKNKSLKNSNEELENFAYIASHDLKEPLRMISAYTSLLKRRYNSLYDDTGKEFMHFVIDATKRMEIMLDDLLNYSRLNSNSNNENNVDINDVLLIVKSNLTKKLEDENAQLIIHQENLPVIKSNQSLMVQLFQNMVSNAIKFRSEKAPIVVLNCEREEDNFIFSIKDNGIGIAKENQKKVFEMFKRLHTREEYEGTGIGLATCRKIIHKYGGDIWLKSEEGIGTTFFFSFPVSISELEPILM